MRADAVADDETVDASTSDDATASNAELEKRVSGVESKLDMILDKLGGARDQAHGAAEQHTEDRLDRPSSIAEEIRAQLAGQRAKDEAAAAGQADADWRKSVDERLTGMAEKMPETPLRRVEKFMGWRE